MAIDKESIYQHLRYRIITNELSAGHQLNERELMAHYGIGRTPLRDVLMLLERDGLINRYPRLGAFVAQMDIHLLRHIIEIRLELEPLAAKLAAERIDAAQLERFTELVHKVDSIKWEAEDFLWEMTRCEYEFHHLIYESTKNEKLNEILKELHGVAARFWNYLMPNRSAAAERVKDVRQMAVILAQRDGDEASRVMRSHILKFVDKIKERVVETD